MEKYYDVDLTYNEIILLDGKVNEKAQKIINTAKLEYGFGFDNSSINKALAEAINLGKLTWRYKQISNCEYCGKKRDYYTYARDSRYHRKGEKNYDKSKYYAGIKFNEGFITMQGYGDMCVECFEKYKKEMIDYIIENDLPIEIQKNDYRVTKYVKDPILICYKCGKEMRESEMGKHACVMGDGYYPSTCPHCGAESLFLGNSHKTTDKFVMMLNPEFK